MNKQRPLLNKKISIKDFNAFYWLKVELIDFCRTIGCSSSGGKIEIANRISEYLETGKVVKKTKNKKQKLPKPTHPITQNTIIGIEYRTYKEKTKYLKSHIGKKFHFTIHLLDYFQKNAGIKTYRDLINEYYKEQEIRKDPNYVSKIAPQFEYNTYIRDFMKNNPDRTRRDAIKYWKIKKSKPGNNKYSKDDVKS